MNGTGPPEPARADVEIAASAQAREPLFHTRPEVRETTTTVPGGESGAESDRTNLPDQVEARTTYRDIAIAHRLAARLSPPPAD